jgi:Ca2+-binding EF-hand superfamily protein
VRLSRRPNFSLKNAFQYCDKSNDNYLSCEDIRNMLADHGFFATERELSSIMKKFDKDLDQRINYSEFVEELTPKVGK